MSLNSTSLVRLPSYSSRPVRMLVPVINALWLICVWTLPVVFVRCHCLTCAKQAAHDKRRMVRNRIMRPIQSWKFRTCSCTRQ